VVSFTLVSLYPQGKEPRYPLNRRLGEPQNQPRRPFVVVDDNNNNNNMFTLKLVSK
jgi:hypothetical protein